MGELPLMGENERLSFDYKSKSIDHAFNTKN